jgi:outer membrane protein OmpA-like peptidoglycan-associated protein
MGTTDTTSGRRGRFLQWKLDGIQSLLVCIYFARQDFFARKRRLVMKSKRWLLLGCASLALAACAENAPSSSTAAAPPSPPASPESTGATAPAAVEALYLYFDADSARLNREAEAVADHAARLYREGNPHVMKIVGHTDATGDELHNLYLSARRAEVVKKALVARGIPAATLEMQAAGQTDLVAPDVKGPDPKDRRAVVTWR